jgi:hypothetical protein
MTAFDDAWSDFEQDTGPTLSDALSKEAPVDTGALAASMEWRDEDGTLTAGSSDSRGPIAAYVARGTRPHEIYPVNATALHFFASNGDEVFTKHVHHPGTVANQFHVRAWESVRSEVTQRFHDKVAGGVQLSYLNPWRNKTLGG